MSENALTSGDFTEENEPYALFGRWLADAGKSEPNDANALALATVDETGLPNVRMVLLKGFDERGFVFYTNFESRKGQEILSAGKAAMCFHWKSLRRQIRIEGVVAPVDDATADAYFATRGRDSQLGAWASEQSRPLADRATFEARFDEMQERFEGQDVPRPPRWSGWRVTPSAIEFWQDREHRLHERNLYARSGDSWTKGLLYP